MSLSPPNDSPLNDSPPNDSPPNDSGDWISLTTEPLPLMAAIVWCTTPDCGAVVSFSGVVRDHAEGRHDVVAMTYEAYEAPALQRLAEILSETRNRWPDVGRLALLHRLGELELGEASVVVVAASPHRDVAFDAGRFAIDTLKTSVPIWKKEHFSGQSEWALRSNDVQSVPTSSVGD